MKKIILILLFILAGSLVAGYITGALGSPSSEVNYGSEASINDSISSTATIPDKKFTENDVSMHSTENDCWMIINNNVYELTSYIPMHPGGPDEIIEECGKDGTRAFTKERKHAKQEVRAELASYAIGSL